MGFSNYLENQVLTHIFRTGSWTKPTSIYIALCTAAPTSVSTGSTIVEPVGNAYARVALNPGNSNWNDPSTGTTSNISVITFPEATGSWGTITHVAIVDSATNGNLLFFGSLGSSQAVSSGDSPGFDTTTLTITLD